MLLASSAALANTPGKHSITYTWKDAACDASVTCTYSLYLATVTGACGDGKFPYAFGFIGATYTTPTLAGGPYFAAVTAVDPTTGGESTCSDEVQTIVPTISTAPATQLQGTVK